MRRVGCARGRAHARLRPARAASPPLPRCACAAAQPTSVQMSQVAGTSHRVLSRCETWRSSRSAKMAPPNSLISPTSGGSAASAVLRNRPPDPAAWGLSAGCGRGKRAASRAATHLMALLMRAADTRRPRPGVGGGSSPTFAATRLVSVLSRGRRSAPPPLLVGGDGAPPSAELASIAARGRLRRRASNRSTDRHKAVGQLRDVALRAAPPARSARSASWTRTCMRRCAPCAARRGFRDA
jgi:hypothetical protein